MDLPGVDADSDKARPMSVEFVFFFLLALGLLVCSVLVITFRNPINSALSLIGSFLFMAGIYALLHAPFMAVIQVMVYAGAIMVLFMFVIMLLNLSDDELGEARVSMFKIGAALAAVGVLAAFGAGIATLRVAPDVTVSEAQQGQTLPEVLGAADLAYGPFDVLVDGKEVIDPAMKLEAGQRIIIKRTRYKGLDRVVASPTDTDARLAAGMPLEGETPLTEEQKRRVKRRLVLWEQFGTVESVGKQLYTKWLLPFEITALLLLAAIVGAVVMAKRRL